MTLALEEDLALIRDRLLGLIPEERIKAVRIPRSSGPTIEGFLGLGDMCSTVSDALDEIGVGGCIAASVLQPVASGQRVCGPAITIRYVREGGDPGAQMQRGKRAKLADRDLYGAGNPGDVGVFDCGAFGGTSVMGSLSTRWARRLGIGGCVVDGAIRDVETMRNEGLPVWSRAVTPCSGKHRMEAVEINGPVSIGGVGVRPGDLVIADDTGICIVPFDHAEEILAICRKTEESEVALIDAIDRGLPSQEIIAILRPEQW